MTNFQHTSFLLDAAERALCLWLTDLGLPSEAMRMLASSQGTASTTCRMRTVSSV
jgi:hypothetical protein